MGNLYGAQFTSDDKEIFAFLGANDKGEAADIIRYFGKVTGQTVEPIKITEHLETEHYWIHTEPLCVKVKKQEEKLYMLTYKDENRSQGFMTLTVGKNREEVMKEIYTNRSESNQHKLNDIDVHVVDAIMNAEIVLVRKTENNKATG